MKKKPFKLVYSLWIVPDFPPKRPDDQDLMRVNHSKVDFNRLADALEELFPYGPAVQFQVPNDTIDVVSMQFRGNSEYLRCEDFGQVLLDHARKSNDRVIDIREAWKNLHRLPDRDNAPPPGMLPFIVTAEDFEDAMIWETNTRPCIGLPVFDPLEFLQFGNKDKEGKLPIEFRSVLKEVFNIPFKEPAVLDRTWSDFPSQEYGTDPRGGQGRKRRP